MSWGDALGDAIEGLFIGVVIFLVIAILAISGCNWYLYQGIKKDKQLIELKEKCEELKGEL